MSQTLVNSRQRSGHLLYMKRRESFHCISYSSISLKIKKNISIKKVFNIFSITWFSLAKSPQSLSVSSPFGPKTTFPQNFRDGSWPFPTLIKATMRRIAFFFFNFSSSIFKDKLDALNWYRKLTRARQSAPNSWS